MKSENLLSILVLSLLGSQSLFADVTVQESKARFYVGRASAQGSGSDTAATAAVESAKRSALQTCKSECAICVVLSKDSSATRGEMTDPGSAGEFQGLGGRSSPSYNYSGSAKVVVVGIE